VEEGICSNKIRGRNSVDETFTKGLVLDLEVNNNAIDNPYFSAYFMALSKMSLSTGIRQFIHQNDLHVFRKHAILSRRLRSFAMTEIYHELFRVTVNTTMFPFGFVQSQCRCALNSSQQIEEGNDEMSVVVVVECPNRRW
jgi:hypothetical protein